MAKILTFEVKRKRVRKYTPKPKPAPKPRQQSGDNFQGEPAKKAPDGDRVKFAETELSHRIKFVGPFRYLDGSPCNVQRLMVEFNKHWLAKDKKNIRVCRATEWII
jgi:hypothetical protein